MGGLRSVDVRLADEFLAEDKALAGRAPRVRSKEQPIRELFDVGGNMADRA